MVTFKTLNCNCSNFEAENAIKLVMLKTRERKIRDQNSQEKKPQCLYISIWPKLSE